MKNIIKNFDWESVVRFFGGLILIAIGIFIFVIRFQIPDITFGGYETSKVLEAIELFWAFGGHLLGVILFVSGLWILGIIQKLAERWL